MFDETNEAKDREIDGLRFECTCTACPEQYDVYFGSQQVGYVRYRWGCLRVDYPDCGGEVLMEESIGNGLDGVLDRQDRMSWLTLIASKINQKIGRAEKEMKTCKKCFQQYEPGTADDGECLACKYKFALNPNGGYDPSKVFHTNFTASNSTREEERFNYQCGSCGSKFNTPGTKTEGCYYGTSSLYCCPFCGRVMYI